MANVAVAAKQQALGNLKRAAPDATEAFPKHPEKLRGRKRPRISNRQHEKVAEPEVAVNAHQTSVDTKRLQAEEEDELRCLSSRARANVEGIMPRIKAQVAERTSTESSRIDLSTAENCLLRDALTATYKHGISSALASKVRAYMPLYPWSTTDDSPKHLSYPQGFTGNPDLLKAIALFVNEHFDPRIPVEPEHVITAPGAASCIDSMLFNLCEPGDGVLVPGPYWSRCQLQHAVMLAPS